MPGPAPELVVLVGLQGGGRSARVAGNLARTHAVVSKDPWPRARHRQARQQRPVAELLAGGRSVVVDNTDPATEDRAPLIAAARLCPPSTAQGVDRVEVVREGRPGTAAPTV